MNITEAAKLKGIHVDVYRNSRGDCTNGGISSKYDRFTVVAILDKTSQTAALSPLPGGVFQASADAPAVVLVKRFIGRELWTIQPLDELGKWYMFGGNYAASSDSRIREVIDFYGAIAVHDRYEG